MCGTSNQDLGDGASAKRVVRDPPSKDLDFHPCDAGKAEVSILVGGENRGMLVHTVCNDESPIAK